MGNVVQSAGRIVCSVLEPLIAVATASATVIGSTRTQRRKLAGVLELLTHQRASSASPPTTKRRHERLNATLSPAPAVAADAIRRVGHAHRSDRLDTCGGSGRRPPEEAASHWRWASLRQARNPRAMRRRWRWRRAAGVADRCFRSGVDGDNRSRQFDVSEDMRAFAL
jgi:hypothetical protein